jgi:hypothetical protein
VPITLDVDVSGDGEAGPRYAPSADRAAVEPPVEPAPAARSAIAPAGWVAIGAAALVVIGLAVAAVARRRRRA